MRQAELHRAKDDNALLNELFSLMAREGMKIPGPAGMVSHTGNRALPRRCGIRLSIARGVR